MTLRRLGDGDWYYESKRFIVRRKYLVNIAIDLIAMRLAKPFNDSESKETE